MFRKLFIVVVIILLVAYLIVWFVNHEREEDIPPAEGIQEIDMSLGDENGEPLPQ